MIARKLIFVFPELPEYEYCPAMHQGIRNVIRNVKGRIYLVLYEL